MSRQWIGTKRSRYILYTYFHDILCDPFFGLGYIDVVYSNPDLTKFDPLIPWISIVVGTFRTYPLLISCTVIDRKTSFERNVRLDL